jgi:hypothetical protein
MAKQRNSNRLIPLDEAPWHFATPALRAEFDHAQSIPSPVVEFKKPKDGTDAIRKLADTINSVVEETKIRNRPLWKMQHRLLGLLHEGRLEAVGIMTKSENSLEPQIIPQFIFDEPAVRWHARTIENVGQKFDHVRVRRPVSVVATLQSGKPTPAPAGRPSKAPEIDKAIKILSGRGVKFNAMPRQVAYDAIKKFAMDELNANVEIGYSDPAIQRCLVRMTGKRA